MPLVLDLRDSPRFTLQPCSLANQQNLWLLKLQHVGQHVATLQHTTPPFYLQNFEIPPLQWKCWAELFEGAKTSTGRSCEIVQDAHCEWPPVAAKLWRTCWTHQGRVRGHMCDWKTSGQMQLDTYIIIYCTWPSLSTRRHVTSCFGLCKNQSNIERLKMQRLKGQRYCKVLGSRSSRPLKKWAITTEWLCFIQPPCFYLSAQTNEATNNSSECQQISKTASGRGNCRSFSRQMIQMYDVILL